MNSPGAVLITSPATDWSPVVDVPTNDILTTSLAGQRDFALTGDDRWGSPVRDSLCWPYGVAARDEALVIADSDTSRVLLCEATS